MRKTFPLLVCLLSFAAVPRIFAGVCSPVVSVAGQTTGLLCNVDSSTSVIAGNYVKWNATRSGVTNGGTSDSAGSVLGIASATVAGSSGNPAQVLIYTSGPVPGVNMDATTTSGDFACVSTGTAGQLHDCGATGNDQMVAWIQSSVTGAGSNSIYFFGHLPNAIPSLTVTSCPISDLGGANYYYFNNSSGACTYTLPVGTGTGSLQRCFGNSAGKSGVLTVAIPASNTIAYKGTNGTTTTGTFVSGGALGDFACFISDAANHWMAFGTVGTWSNN